MEKLSKQFSELNIKNRGIFAGGKNTNKNGLPYEEKTSIEKFKNYKTKKTFGKNKNDFFLLFKFNGIKIRKFQKSGLKNYLIDDFNKECEKTLVPDEAFLHKKSKTIYILEKKFQQCSGSVDEKIQSGPFKLYYYQKMYPDYNIKFCYVLSEWFFKKKKYKPELRFLKEYNIKIFNGNDNKYIKKLIFWLKNN